jgi:thioredoxin-like negative regulator of GroEL
MEMDFAEVSQLFEQNELGKAKEMLDQLILAEPSGIQMLLLRGRIFCKMQQWGNAMNDYSAILDVEPNNSEAKSGLAMARNILGYFTPDMFNP